jgi:demethylspheroidene O-methyltransferase
MPPDLGGAVPIGTVGVEGESPAPRAFSLLDWRDRLVAKPGFRRWAARFALTRPIARRRARDLFDLSAGFVYAQILHACLELNLFTLLAEGPQTAARLAARIDLPAAGAQRLLDAAVALRLVARRRGGRFGLGELGAALVGNDGVAAMVAHHAMLYADLADPVALLRGQNEPTRLSAYWAYARRDPAAGAMQDGACSDAETEAYTRLMAASQPLVAGEILDAFDVRPHRVLLDAGGGDGSFLRAAAARAPDLRLVLFDLPPVAERARAAFAAAGLSERARAVGGSFLTDSWPDGADLISLVRVVHDHDDAQAMQLLRAARAAIAPGGTLLLAEPMAATPGAERMGDAYFGFYLLAMGSGRPRSLAVLSAMLREAGFAKIRRLPTGTPLLISILTARAA